MKKKTLLLTAITIVSLFAISFGISQAYTVPYQVEAAVSQSTVYIHYTPGYGVAVWTTYTADRHTTGKTLPSGSSWKVFNSIIGSDGNLWYNLGGNQWVSSEYAKPYKSDPVITKGTLTIKYTPGYGIAVWNSPDVNTQKTIPNKKLQDQTSWKYFKKVTYPNGNIWYNLGGDQWIDGQYASLGTNQTVARQKVVSFAQQQIGKPYVWGASGPNSFDCGGLVKYVYKNAVNIDLPMGTFNQEKYGQDVSLQALLPGDLLFYGNRGNTYHVGIYIGDGKMIHAPQPGQNVTVIEIKYFEPSFARRILN